MFILLAACVHTTSGSCSMTKTGTFTVHLAPSGGTEVTLTVENTGEDAGVFCTYHTPFEGIRNHIFVIERGGKPVDYIGMMAKRAPPGPEDFVSLTPGTSKGPVQVDLARGYTLTSGTYTVRYRGTNISGLPDSNTVQLVIP